MPRCMHCDAHVKKKSDLTLCRDGQGRWIAMCAECTEKRKAEEKRAPAHLESINQPGAAIKDALARAAAQSELDAIADEVDEELNGPVGAFYEEGEPEEPVSPTGTPDHAFEEIRQILSGVMKEERQRGPRFAHARASERQSVDLRVSFSLIRDDTRYSGRVKDISEGGMRFTTAHPLKQGNVIVLSVDALQKSIETNTATFLQSTAEVRRSSKLADGTYEVGVRYVRRDREDYQDRRQQKRHRVLLRAYYQRKGSELIAVGRVADISQIGVRIYMTEELPENEAMYMTIRGESGAFAKADLVGVVKTIRTDSISQNVWEVGCSFVKLTPRARGEPEA